MILLTDSDVTGAVLGQTLVIAPEVLLTSPGTTITWTHNGVDLSTRKDRRVRITPNGRLSVADVRASDRGTYELSATNAHGTVTESVNVTINCKLLGGSYIASYLSWLLVADPGFHYSIFFLATVCWVHVRTPREIVHNGAFL